MEGKTDETLVAQLKNKLTPFYNLPEMITDPSRLVILEMDEARKCKELIPVIGELLGKLAVMEQKSIELTKQTENFANDTIAKILVNSLYHLSKEERASLGKQLLELSK